MKRLLLLSIAFTAAVLHASGQANTKLSNLAAPIAINVDLLPASSNAFNLGNSTKAWNNLYLTGIVHLNRGLFLHNRGTDNTFLGDSSGKAITTGIQNTGLGDKALFANSSGSQNTACGYFTLNRTTTGRFNTAMGAQALEDNSTGNSNTAVGAYSLYNNTASNNNTAIGSSSLSNSKGSYNTAVGSSAGSFYSYSNCVFVGYSASGEPNVTNATAVGYRAWAYSSNQVRIGNASVISIGGYAAWTKFSDGRFKKNIKEEVPGLKFITQLRPVVYTVDVDALENTLHAHTGASAAHDQNRKESRPAPSAEETAARQAGAQMKHTGFIAQEVEEAAGKIGYDFSGVDKPKNNKEFYGLRYADFVVPLVKAVQELDAANKEKEEKIVYLETELNTLKERIQKLEAFLTSGSNNNAGNVAGLPGKFR